MCHAPLAEFDDDRVLRCPAGHSFDRARQGYVNLLRTGQRRPPGDSVEMVRARKEFLATGTYEPLSERLNSVCATGRRNGADGIALDVGCGEGYYTRRLAHALADVPFLMCGIDVAKSAVASAAVEHRAGHYAVASAFDLPLPPSSVSLLLSVFGPVAEDEFARVVAPGGMVAAVHPGPGHLFALRALVYDAPARHQVKDPLRNAGRWFAAEEPVAVRFPIHVASSQAARQLLTMTPYRWHAPRDIDARLAAIGAFDTEVDVVVSTYRKISGTRQ